MYNNKIFLLIEGITSIIFMLLVIFTMDENTAKLVIILYSIVWIPAACLSVKIYNNIVDSDDTESE